MTTTLAGYIAIFFGLLWAVWPKTLRWWMVGKASWALYWLLVGYVYIPLSTLVEGYGVKGWVGLAVGLVVLGTLLRKAVGVLAVKLPLIAFRVVGALNLAIGLYLVWAP